jgi:hypothetical protein
MSVSNYEVRRTILRATIFLPVLSIIPMGKGEPVTTTVAITKIVGAVITGLQALTQSRTDRALRSNVEAVLASVQTIIAQQKDIIQELQNIQKLIVSNNLKMWADAYSREIEAYAAELRVNLKDLNNNRGEINPQLKQRFMTLADQCAKVTNSAGALDPFTFCFFITGVGIVLICEEILKSTVRIAAWKAEFVKPINRWLDATRADSMPAILAQTRSEITILKQQLADRPKEYTIGIRTDKVEHEDGYCYYKTQDIVIISGDYNSGFSGTPRSDTIAGPFGCHTHVGHERMAAAPDDFKPAEPSTDPYIKDLNDKRDQIRKLELAESDQRILLGQMEEFQRFLTSNGPRRT